MERETSARFYFLLGLPAVILAGAVELHTLTKAGLSTAGWLTLLVGIFAGIFAFVAIWELVEFSPSKVKSSEVSQLLVPVA